MILVLQTPTNDEQGDHFVLIRVEGSNGVEYYSFTVTVYSWIIELNEGWNLISIPYVPTDTSITGNQVGFAEILRDVDSIWSYQYNSPSAWSYYNGGGLNSIVPGRGYWVKMNSEAKLKGFIDKARIIKGKVIRKEELKGFKNLVKERSYWKKTVSKITNKAISIKNIKKDIFEFAKKVLPENVRGKLLASVAKAETRGQLASAFKKIINERNIIIRKGLTTNLSKIIKGIEKLPLKWQDKIIHEMDKIAFKGMNKKKQ